MIDGVQDQAAGLRARAESAATRLLPVFAPRGYAAASVNLAAALATGGHRVLIMDATRGEIAPAFGLAARYELIHVIEGDKALAETALVAPCGARVLPAARGLQMVSAHSVSGLDLFEDIVNAAAPVDLILVHAEPTAIATLLQLPGRNEAALVVQFAEDALPVTANRLKVLATHFGFLRFRLIATDAPADFLPGLVDQLAPVAKERWGVQLTAGATIPRDAALRHAQRAARTVFDIDPDSPAAKAYRFAASSLTDWQLARIEDGRDHRAHPAML